MNLVLEMGERVTTGGIDKGEIRSKAEEGTDAPTTDSLGEMYGAFVGLDSS